MRRPSRGYFVESVKRVTCDATFRVVVTRPEFLRNNTNNFGSSLPGAPTESWPNFAMSGCGYTGCPSAFRRCSDASKGWGNVRFDGGGFVDGIVASSKEQGLFYARTDVGGAYRWNSAQRVWVPLLDGLSQDDVGLYGVESIAIDDNNPGRLYVLAGTTYFSNSKTVIFRSQDYGASFDIVDVSSLWRAHGNGLGRQTGEKLAVDPNNPNILFWRQIGR